MGFPRSPEGLERKFRDIFSPRLSGWFESPEKKRHQSSDDTKPMLKTLQPNLSAVHIPSSSLFASTSVDDHSVSSSTQVESSDSPYAANHPKEARVSEPSLPAFTHPATPATPQTLTPRSSSSSTFKPTRSILKKSPTQKSNEEHTSPADTLANTSRNVLLTSSGNPGSPMVRNNNALPKDNQRCVSLPTTSSLPLIPLAEAEYLAAVVNEQDNAETDDSLSKTDSSISTPETSPTGQKKSVRFNHADIHHYVASRCKHSSQSDPPKISVEINEQDDEIDVLLREAEQLRALFLDGLYDV